MKFYEPGKYEDFIGKLASIQIRPSEKVWTTISDHLSKQVQARTRTLYQRIAVAAGFLLIFSVSWLSFHFLGSHLYNDIPLHTSTDYSAEGNSYYSTDFYGSEVSEPIYNLDTRLPMAAIPLNEQIPLQNQDAHGRDATYCCDPISSLKTTKIQWNSTVDLRIQSDFSPERQTSNTQYYDESKGQAINAMPIKQRNKWEVTAFVNPTYAYHTIAALNQSMNPNELGAWMWGGDILVKKRIGRYFSVSTGLQLSPLGQINKNLVLLRSDSYNKDMMILSANTSFGMVSLENKVVAVSNFSYLPSAPSSVIKSSSITPARLRQYFYFLEIPILFASHFSNKNFELEFKLGCSTGILVANQFEVISNEGIFYGKTENVRPYITNVIGAISLAVPLNNNLAIYLEPRVTLSVTPISFNHESTHPFSSAIKVGIGYKF